MIINIINIIVAIIISIGFWRNTSKEFKRKIAKASFTKTVILLLLSVAMMAFYYKSYQVATFRNWVEVQGIKGSYTNKNDTVVYEGDTIINYSKDRIRQLTILSRFTNNDAYTVHPFWAVWDSIYYGGIRTYFMFFNDKGDTKIYPNLSENDLHQNLEEYSHKYRVLYYTNTIPNFMPLTYYDNYTFYTDGHELYNGISYEFGNYALKTTENVIKDIDGFYDRYFVTSFSFKNNNVDKESFGFKIPIISKYVNTLNFFSAADLSQCEFEVKLTSDIPIDILCMYFDLPIEISSYDPKEYHVTLKGFHYNIKEDIVGKERYFIFHVKFPTLANLQLIRSLILTTLLTALLALFFKNSYYYYRNLAERKKRKHGTHYSVSKKLILLWVPVGKIILWTFILLFSLLLILSILNVHFRINAESKPFVYITLNVIFILYIIILNGIFYFLYRKGIHIRDLKEQLLCIFKKREKRKDDDIPSSKKEEQPIETTKIDSQPEMTTKVEDSKNIENTKQKDGQKSLRQPSHPQKRTFKKKKQKKIRSKKYRKR